MTVDDKYYIDWSGEETHYDILMLALYYISNSTLNPTLRTLGPIFISASKLTDNVTPKYDCYVNGEKVLILEKDFLNGQFEGFYLKPTGSISEFVTCVIMGIWRR